MRLFFNRGEFCPHRLKWKLGYIKSTLYSFPVPDKITGYLHELFLGFVVLSKFERTKNDCV